MSVLIFEPRTPKSLEEMYYYMSDTNKTTCEAMFGIGVTIEEVVPQMKFVQSVYKIEKILHEYLQVIFCFDVGIRRNITFLKEVCERIGRVLITDERQVFGAIHYFDKPDNIHCHYMINFVGIDGSLYRQKFSVQIINVGLMKYWRKNLSPIISY